MCLQPRGRIINAVAEMVLLKRVQALLELPTAGPDAPTLMHMERTLTDGYAWALALEAERARLARRLGDLAARETGNPAAKTDELATLARKMAEADVDLARLRRSLSLLRRRATAVRAATAVA
jgi:hypothetical protein